MDPPVLAAGVACRRGRSLSCFAPLGTAGTARCEMGCIGSEPSRAFLPAHGRRPQTTAGGIHTLGAALGGHSLRHAGHLEKQHERIGTDSPTRRLKKINRAELPTPGSRTSMWCDHRAYGILMWLLHRRISRHVRSPTGS